MFARGNIVKDKRYGYKGMIDKSFRNWDDLKYNQDFLTIDPNNESNQMDGVEKLIKGDPKDAWLKAQIAPFSEEQLNERWYSVRCLDGGTIWICESLIEMIDNSLN